MATISSYQRRLADAQRRAAIQKSNLWARNLATKRSKEVERVIAIASDRAEARNWAMVFDTEFSEAAYFPSWYQGLIVNSGLLGVKPVVRSLAGAAAAKTFEYGIFEQSLMDYAQMRAADKVVTVSGTLLDALKGEIYRVLDEDINCGVERMAQALRQYSKDNQLWMARRIAQTESLAGLAEGSHEAAESLDIPHTKVWVTSGLQNTRDSHLAMDGKEIDGNDMFIFDDCQMRYAHDMDNGTAAQVVNCACDTQYRPK